MPLLHARQVLSGQVLILSYCSACSWRSAMLAVCVKIMVSKCHYLIFLSSHLLLPFDIREAGYVFVYLLCHGE
jgi:hypothetical protein